MAKKPVKTVTPWYDAPLANGWIAWGVIVAAALALVLAVAKRGCECKCDCKTQAKCCAKAKH